MPLTQKDMGDALALSLVHVNRTLMELRRLGVITLRQHVLTVHDADALAGIAGFDPGYLMLSEPADARDSSVLATLKRSTLLDRTPTHGMT